MPLILAPDANPSPYEIAVLRTRKPGDRPYVLSTCHAHLLHQTRVDGDDRIFESTLHDSEWSATASYCRKNCRDMVVPSDDEWTELAFDDLPATPLAGLVLAWFDGRCTNGAIVYHTKGHGRAKYRADIAGSRQELRWDILLDKIAGALSFKTTLIDLPTRH